MHECWHEYHEHTLWSCRCCLGSCTLALRFVLSRCSVWNCLFRSCLIRGYSSVCQDGVSRGTLGSPEERQAMPASARGFPTSLWRNHFIQSGRFVEEFSSFRRMPKFIAVSTEATGCLASLVTFGVPPKRFNVVLSLDHRFLPSSLPRPGSFHRPAFLPSHGWLAGPLDGSLRTLRDVRADSAEQISDGWRQHRRRRRHRKTEEYD